MPHRLLFGSWTYAYDGVIFSRGGLIVDLQVRAAFDNRHNNTSLLSAEKRQKIWRKAVTRTCQHYTAAWIDILYIQSDLITLALDTFYSTPAYSLLLQQMTLSNDRMTSQSCSKHDAFGAQAVKGERCQLSYINIIIYNVLFAWSNLKQCQIDRKWQRSRDFQFGLKTSCRLVTYKLRLKHRH